MYHVYPMNDEKPHELEGTMCSCGPRVEWNDPETGEAYAEALVIHNAFDCRPIPPPDAPAAGPRPGEQPNSMNDTEMALRLIADPKTPWGKVLGYSWSTNRWVDNYPITVWQTVWRFLCGNGWRRTENRHLLKPGDAGYDPTPYKVTHIL